MERLALDATVKSDPSYYLKESSKGDGNAHLPNARSRQLLRSRSLNQYATGHYATVASDHASTKVAAPAAPL